ncbi:Elongation factor Ts [Limihaloglobus sulfuriphilus]|uniref:Elongation factor Ts n=1 Tax=Limihaloglobus sulfuriphilus TaxID=1851148 RepID=A0A1Q2MEC5_9BACT|nr:translation elongation factor Ts [Limihaloglobus sulfuriphilus]AQQ70657.1 Elongation factor Ts [Limihaloglobus sulfuriphilus]
MADITAATVMKLRKMTGQGMMDCKKALQETNGDLDEAMTLLRKKGLATMEKRSGRDTGEGRVVTRTDANTTILASLCCETDFVAKNDDFIALSEKMLDYVAACDCENGQKLEDVELNGEKFSELITVLVSKTGEKTEVGDCAKFTVGDNSYVGTYIHFNNKVAGMVEIECDSADTANSTEIKEIANGVCMHITAAKPEALNKEDFDKEELAKEEAIARDQVKDKPANIIDKIVEGKINKMLSERCLVNQKYVVNEDMTVEEAVNAAAKAAGGTASIKRFARIEIA